MIFESGTCSQDLTKVVFECVLEFELRREFQIVQVLALGQRLIENNP